METKTCTRQKSMFPLSCALVRTHRLFRTRVQKKYNPNKDLKPYSNFSNSILLHFKYIPGKNVSYPFFFCLRKKKKILILLHSSKFLRIFAAKIRRNIDCSYAFGECIKMTVSQPYTEIE